jgi:hypothetical protein
MILTISCEPHKTKHETHSGVRPDEHYPEDDEGDENPDWM